MLPSLELPEFMLSAGMVLVLPAPGRMVPLGDTLSVVPVGDEVLSRGIVVLSRGIVLRGVVLRGVMLSLGVLAESAGMVEVPLGGMGLSIPGAMAASDGVCVPVELGPVGTVD